MTKNPPLKRAPAAKPEPVFKKPYPNYLVADQDGYSTADNENEAPVITTETEARGRAVEWAKECPGETIRVYQLIMEIRCDVSEPNVSHVTDHPK